jgi:hypothetical protein
MNMNDQSQSQSQSQSPAPCYIIINEQHTLLPAQQHELDLHNRHNGYNYIPLLVPADGWTLAQQRTVFAETLAGQATVFLSPIPYLLGLCAALNPETYVFHNDRREKKELPNGKVISVTAPDGWQLVALPRPVTDGREW